MKQTPGLHGVCLLGFSFTQYKVLTATQGHPSLQVIWSLALENHRACFAQAPAVLQFEPFIPSMESLLGFLDS